MCPPYCVCCMYDKVLLQHLIYIDNYNHNGRTISVKFHLIIFQYQTDGWWSKFRFCRCVFSTRLNCKCKQMEARSGEKIQTRQAVYVQCNTEASLCNHCSRGKAISITYSGCVFVALISQHARRMRHTMSSVACLAIHHIFPHYLINGTTFGEKKCYSR